MALISELLSASAQLHNPIINAEYDRRVRELVDYFKRLLSTKTLESSANDETFLDVGNPACCPTDMNILGHRLTYIVYSISIQRQILSHIFSC
jgi:hypothetical protein